MNETATLYTSIEIHIKKYDPEESITCPKCGKTYVAGVMGPQYIVPKFMETACLTLTSLCGFEFYRYPLDYKEPT